ncbi:MAG: hypothetical protein U1F43_11910 [Myxococcota bacterium]
MLAARPFFLSSLPVCLAVAVSCASSDDGPSDATGDATSDIAADVAACPTCFLHGRWQIDNLSPCFTFAADQTTVTAATSTFVSGGVAQCPIDGQPPTAPWASDHLTVDCPGHYRLCLTLKAATGDGTAADWAHRLAVGARRGAACAQQLVDSGGYAELRASGLAFGCGKVERVFARIRYCPRALQPPRRARLRRLLQRQPRELLSAACDRLATPARRRSQGSLE